MTPSTSAVSAANNLNAAFQQIRAARQAARERLEESERILESLKMCPRYQDNIFYRMGMWAGYRSNYWPKCGRFFVNVPYDLDYILLLAEFLDNNPTAVWEAYKHWPDVKRRDGPSVLDPQLQIGFKDAKHAVMYKLMLP